MSNTYSKEQLLQRGWSEDKIEVLLDKPYKEMLEITLDNQKKITEKIGWNKKHIRKVEKYDEFINFVGKEEYLNGKQYVVAKQLQMTVQASAEFKLSLPAPQKTLLDSIDKYRVKDGLEPEIIHVNPNFKYDESYQVFTDGALKVVGNHTFVSYAGWIRNSKNELVVEFAKELDDSYFEGNHNFEIFGIAAGLSIAKSLGLKNLSCYTDSSGEAKILSLAKAGFSQERSVDLPEIYQPIIADLKELNAQICYIPREYNSYADKLTKIHMIPYEEKTKKLKEQQQTAIQNGTFEYDYSNNNIYFFHPKVNKADYNPDNAKWCLFSYIPEKIYYNFLINTQTNEYFLISKEESKEQLKVFKDLPDNERHAKSSSTDVKALLNLNKCLEQIKDMDIKDLTIRQISPGFNVMLEKIIPIKTNVKSEMYEFHQKANSFDNIYISEIPKELFQDIKRHMAEIATQTPQTPKI